VRVTLVVLLLPLLVSCAHTPARQTPINPAGFPLYPQSNVLAVRDWHRSLSSSERNALGISDGAGTYEGHEVVTSTQATFDDLLAWLRRLDARPPDGYRIGLWGSGVDDARAQARSIGIDFSVFDRTERSGAHDVVVVTVDPSLVQRKAGLMLSAITRFRYLPAFLRAPLDAQALAQTGFTISEALDPNTPIGAAIDALGRLNGAHGRGVIFIDASPVDAR